MKNNGSTYNKKRAGNNNNNNNNNNKIILYGADDNDCNIQDKNEYDIVDVIIITSLSINNSLIFINFDVLLRVSHIGDLE